MNPKVKQKVLELLVNEFTTTSYSNCGGKGVPDRCSHCLSHNKWTLSHVRVLEVEDKIEEIIDKSVKA